MNTKPLPTSSYRTKATALRGADRAGLAGLVDAIEGPDGWTLVPLSTRQRPVIDTGPLADELNAAADDATPADDIETLETDSDTDASLQPDTPDATSPHVETSTPDASVTSTPFNVSTLENPCAAIWATKSAHPNMDRKKLIAALVKAGIAKSTCNVQLYKYDKADVATRTKRAANGVAVSVK